MEVALSPDLEELVSEQVECGNFPNPGEVVREALRLFKDHLDQRVQNQEALRRDVQVGLEALDKGDYDEYEADEIQQLAFDIKARGRERLQAPKPGVRHQAPGIAVPV